MNLDRQTRSSKRTFENGLNNIVPRKRPRRQKGVGISKRTVRELPRKDRGVDGKAEHREEPDNAGIWAMP